MSMTLNPEYANLPDITGSDKIGTEFFTVNKVLVRFGITRMTLMRWGKINKLKPVAVARALQGPRLLMYHVSDLERVEFEAPRYSQAISQQDEDDQTKGERAADNEAWATIPIPY